MPDTSGNLFNLYVFWDQQIHMQLENAERCEAFNCHCGGEDRQCLPLILPCVISELGLSHGINFFYTLNRKLKS